MKGKIFNVMIILFFPVLCFCAECDDWQWVERQKKLFEATPAEMGKIIIGVKEKFKDRFDRINALAILQLGTPYLLFCLGEEKEPDKDPVFRLDSMDCATFVMTTAALLHCSSLDDARTQMIKANYRHVVTYQERLHYTTDRIEVSPFFDDITEKIAGKDNFKIKNILLNKIKSDGKRIINIPWEKEIGMKYIPNKFITKELLKKAPRSCGIAFIKEKYAEQGVDVAHEGLLFNGDTLIHASSTANRVVKVGFYEYYWAENKPNFSGIILFEIK